MEDTKEVKKLDFRLGWKKKQEHISRKTDQRLGMMESMSSDRGAEHRDKGGVLPRFWAMERVQKEKESARHLLYTLAEQEF